MSGAMEHALSIAESFSVAPAGRYRSDGPNSGERFRDDLLEPALRGGCVKLMIDGVATLPSSFLEEALGGLVRKGWAQEDLRARLEIVALTPRMQSYKPQAWTYIEEASAQAQNAAPGR